MASSNPDNEDPLLNPGQQQRQPTLIENLCGCLVRFSRYIKKMHILCVSLPSHLSPLILIYSVV